MKTSLSTTIKRQYFDEIIAKHKRDEYRADTPYWQKRIEGKTIDKLTLICGRDVLTVTVAFWSKINTPDTLREVVKTDMCYRLALIHDTIVMKGNQ